MVDTLSADLVQHWLESCPQGYLQGTVYGHGADELELALLTENEVLREDAIRTASASSRPRRSTRRGTSRSSPSASTTSA
jgi:hypothetical protein